MRRAIATRRGSCSWIVDHAGWVVTLHSAEDQDFYGKTLEEALTCCLAWLVASSAVTLLRQWGDRRSYHAR